jgi:hypothetical protein
MGWGQGEKGRDVVTRGILPRVFLEKGVTVVVTRRDSRGKSEEGREQRGERRGSNVQLVTLNN